nr:hypothetical protein [uncultured Methanoregula sp.]
MTTTRGGKTSDNTQFLDVYTLKVGAQQIRAFGNGSIVGGVDNRGILYISLKDNTATPVQLEGKIRLALRNAAGTRTEVILEEVTEKLRASKTDKTQAYMLGLIDALKARQDSFLVIQYQARDSTTASKTITDANCDLVLPVTTYTL